MLPLILYSIFTITSLAVAQPSTKAQYGIADVLNSKLHKPSNSRKVALYSWTGRFLEVSDNGRVTGAMDKNSKGIYFELQAYGVSHRRIKKPGSMLFVAINKYGKAYTQRSPHPDLETLFEEIVGDASVTYKNVKHGWLLSIKKNGKAKKAVRPVRHNGVFPNHARFFIVFPEKKAWGEDNETKGT